LTLAAISHTADSIHELSQLIVKHAGLYDMKVRLFDSREPQQ